MDSNTLLLILLVLAGAAVILLVVLLLRRPEQRMELALREEQRSGRSELREQLESLSRQQETRIEGFGRNLTELSTRTDQRLDLLREALGEDARRGRQESGEQQQRFSDTLSQRLNELTQRNELRIGEMRSTLESRLKELQADNAAKLELMRATVDEKLHATLETRLTESFGNVTTMLAQVHQGLGDMNKLAADVGGLQRVLNNVKSRGVFGEVQLAGLLEQVFAPDQYAANVETIPGTGKRVEFAVRFPGSSADAAVWLPIDAKFPREDYERLLDAQEKADIDGVRAAGDALERTIKKQALEIRKYVATPHTTEFAVMFLPTEGLYAEVLRRPGLFEAMQRDHRITLAGPTTLLALLTSLHVGFRTLAIEKRSSEVWRILDTAKKEFGKFGDVLDSVKVKLDQASKQIDNTGARTRAIERSLREVGSLTTEGEQGLLASGIDQDPQE